MGSCLRCAGGRKKTLDFCKGWMLGKYDPFEVVLDPATDPGADKRGLLWSGQALSRGEDTGGATPLPTPRNFFRKGAGVGAAQLTQFICTCLRGQTLGEAERIPVAECLWCRDPHHRRGHHAPDGLDLRQRRNVLPP